MRQKAHPHRHRIKDDRGAADRRQIQRQKQRHELHRENRANRQPRPQIGPPHPVGQPAMAQPQPHKPCGQNRPRPRKEHRLQTAVGVLDDDLVRRQEQGDAQQRRKARSVQPILAHTCPLFAGGTLCLGHGKVKSARNHWHPNRLFDNRTKRGGDP
jgi:hypothetical protein